MFDIIDIPDLLDLPSKETSNKWLNNTVEPNKNIPPRIKEWDNIDSLYSSLYFNILFDIKL